MRGMSENKSGKDLKQDDLGAILNDAAHVFKESVAPALAQAGREMGAALDSTMRELSAQQQARSAQRQAELERQRAAMAEQIAARQAKAAEQRRLAARHNSFVARQLAYGLAGGFACLVAMSLGMGALGSLFRFDLVGLAFSGAMAAGALLLGVHLLRVSGGVRRAEGYLKFMDGWVGCTLAELSQHTRLPADRLAADLEWLIRHRVLTGVWLDREGGILFTDAGAYQEYLAQRRAAAKPAETAAPAEESAEAVLAQGRSFLQQTAQLRARIEDVQVHARVVQMEQIVQGLLGWVKENPAGASKLRRLTRYYLPTTLKLLRTYTSVDDNPGEKARQICQEIDRILDTVNQALLQLQDTLLADTALDVSAEISALESMLAQEGLTGPSLELAGAPASGPYVPGVKGEDGRL